MSDWEQIRQRFNRRFAPCGIEELPIDALPSGKVRLIVQKGWTIWLRFYTNTDDGRNHLDYYAAHRLSDDIHCRMYADGEEESLPAIVCMYAIPKNATEEDVKEARAQHFSRNQEIEKLLEEKGFVMTDQAHSRAILERYMSTHPEK